MRASTDDSALRGVRGPLALICAVVVLLAGCSATHRDPASKVPLVPWDGALPPQLQAGHVVPASPCRASRLRVVGTGFLFQPAIAGGTGSVTLRNAGPGACRLTGRPDVRLVGAVPAPQQRQVPLPAEPPAFPTVVAPDATLLALPAGGTATLGVDWRNWCLPHGRRAPVAPLEGRRGEVVRFAVQLHNASAEAVRFDRCPLLIEMLAPAGRAEVHQLNCRAASPIQPAGSLRFEMRIRVPADAPAAGNCLFWDTAPTGAQARRQ